MTAPRVVELDPPIRLSDFADTAERVVWRQAFMDQFAGRAPQAWERLVTLEHYAASFILARRTSFSLTGTEAVKVQAMANRFIATLTQEVTRWAIDHRLDVPWIIEMAVSTLRSRASQREHGYDGPETLRLPSEGIVVAHPDGVDILETTGRLVPFCHLPMTLSPLDLPWEQGAETFAQYRRRVKDWVDDELMRQFADARAEGRAGMYRSVPVPVPSRIDWTIDAYVLDLLPETILRRPGPKVTKEAIRLGIRETAAILGLPPREWDERSRRWRVREVA